MAELLPQKPFYSRENYFDENNCIYRYIQIAICWSTALAALNWNVFEIGGLSELSDEPIYSLPQVYSIPYSLYRIEEEMTVGRTLLESILLNYQ